MNQLTLAILIAALLPVVCAAIAKWGAQGYDNNHPRAWMSTQSGFRARADAAQKNSLEAFPPFAVTLILAWVEGVPESLLSPWAWAFIACRVAYIALYVTDRATWRSAVWILGLIVVLRLFAFSI